MAPARVVATFLAVVCCTAVGATVAGPESGISPSFRSVLAWSSGGASNVKYDLRDTSEQGFASLVGALVRPDDAPGSVVVVAVAQGGQDQQAHPPSAAAWRHMLPSALRDEAASVALPYLEAGGLVSVGDVAVALKGALPHLSVTAGAQVVQTTPSADDIVVLELAELAGYLQSRSGVARPTVVVLSAPFIDTATPQAHQRELAEASEEAAPGLSGDTTIVFVRMTPDIATGLLVSALLIGVLLIGVNCLMSIGSPSRFVSTPLPPGKDF